MLGLFQAPILASTLFAGAAIFINLVEHPARLACGNEIAATQFPQSYRRTVPMQVTLALIATFSGIAVWMHRIAGVKLHDGFCHDLIRILRNIKQMSDYE